MQSSSKNHESMALSMAKCAKMINSLGNKMSTYKIIYTESLCHEFYVDAESDDDAREVRLSV